LSETTPLFITVGFVGDFTGVNFSSTAAFQASPTVKILVSRSIDTAKLADGCPDLNLLFFNESTSQWESVAKPTRDASQDNGSFCGYELKPGHWSKFAVGGVKIAANVLQSIITAPSGSGGGASSLLSASSAGNVNSGSGTTSTITVGGNTISLKFDNVISSGQISASQISPTRIAHLFKSISVNSATLTVDAGSQGGTTPYSVAGNIYDIDASAVNYKGPVQLSIPYDPSRLPAGTSESDVRFLHYNGKGWEDATMSVDTVAKLVKGNVSSLL
jgi:hypothetical protein